MKIAPISMAGTNLYTAQNKNNISFGKIEEGANLECVSFNPITHKALDFYAKTDLVTVRKALDTIEDGHPFLSANKEAIAAHPKKERIEDVCNKYHRYEMMLALDEDEALDKADPNFICKLAATSIAKEFAEDLQLAISDEESPKYKMDEYFDYIDSDDIPPEAYEGAPDVDQWAQRMESLRYLLNDGF